MIFRSDAPSPLALEDLPDGPEAGTLLARLDDIPDHGGYDITLNLNEEGGMIRLLIQRYNNEWMVFENRCPHAGTPLNLFDSRFLDINGSRIICRTHGALFEPLTGRCTNGPCKGQYLRRVRVEVTDKAIFSA